MKRKNDSNPKRHGKEDLGFLDDRMQLLETVREMINIELERRGMTPGTLHPMTGDSSLPTHRRAEHGGSAS